MALARGAERIGPVNSSGTSKTIRATRMIAPVSRSFTLAIHSLRAACACSLQALRAAGAARGRLCLVYPKPLQRRSHGVHRAAHDDAIAGLRAGARQLTARFDRVGERHCLGGLCEAL